MIPTPIEKIVETGIFGVTVDLFRGRDGQLNKEFNQSMGDRSQIFGVTFTKTFHEIPEVTISLSGIDAGGIWTRIKLNVESINKTGFHFEVQTWADTKIHVLAISWIAISL